MHGNIEDRMKHWARVQSAIDGFPVRRVWEIFNKMLIDRQKFIFGPNYGWYGFGFLLRQNLRLSSFIGNLMYTMRYKRAIYPLHPAESGLPVLDSYSKISQYGTRKYPELHRAESQQYPWYLDLDEYGVTDFYKTSSAGGDDESTYLTQNQLFEKLWNLLHYFGGVCLIDDQGTNGIPYYETGGNSRFPGRSFSYSEGYAFGETDSGAFNGLRCFYTPKDNREYKYVCIANLYRYGYQGPDVSETEMIQHYLGPNILYESDWIRGPFSSPWIKEKKRTFDYHDIHIHSIRLHVYPRFPDFYDPMTLEPVYF